MLFLHSRGPRHAPVEYSLNSPCFETVSGYVTVITIYNPSRCRRLNHRLGIHIVQMDLAPRTSAFALVFPKYSFYVPNPRILGTRPVLPCKNGCCCKLELVEQRACSSYGTVPICLPWVAHRWNCHTSKFGSCCAYRSGEIRVLRISHSCICFPWATDTVRSQLFSNS